MAKNLKDAEFYEDLAEALHDLVKFAPGGNSARRIAALTSLPYSTLMNGLSGTDSNAGCQLKIESLEPLLAAAGAEKFMARYFSIKAGGVFVELPRIAPDSLVDRASIKVVKEFGELMATYGKALEDGAIDHADLLIIRKEGREAVEAILSLIKTAEIMEG